jgi:peptidoglycan-associated lipoprotein
MRPKILDMPLSQCVAMLAVMVVVAGCATTSRQNSSLQATSASGGSEPGQASINVQGGTEEDFIVNIGRRTFFAEGSAALDETAKVTLDKQAMWLNQHSDWKVKLQGFADDPGSASQQKALSQKRADAVKDYLASRGISPDRMKAKGYGRDRLVGDCADIECQSQNRRVITNPQEAPDF